MLRNTKPIRHASLSSAARALTVGFLAALGLLVAGLRGPAAGEAAQAQPPAKAVGSAQVSGGESFNLAFLPADAKMVLAIRPKALLERREFRIFVDQIKQTLKAVEAAKIEDIDQLLVFWEGMAKPPVEPGRDPFVPPPSGIVLRMTKAQEWNPILNALVGLPRAVHHAGETYLTPTGPRAGGWAAFAADDRTLLIAPEDLLRELIEDRNAPAPRHPWDEGWQKVVKGQLMLALDARWLRRRLAQSLRAGPAAPGQSPPTDLTLDTLSPLLNKTQSYALAIDTANGLVVDLVAAASSDNDAKPVADTISALLTLARNAVEGMRHDRRAQPLAATEAIDWAFQAADALLDNARVDTSAKYVHVVSRASLDLAAGVKLLAPALSAAQTASLRNRSANNLKQIALAISNYANVNDGRLPAPVLYGGANKSIPYSWRVAILPFLEQDDLYKQYNFDEPWDGPNNRKLIDKMPSTFSYPGPTGGASSRTDTAYFVLTGETTTFGAAARGNEPAHTIADISDGMSYTIMAVEAKRAIPWTKPEDIPFDPKGALPELGGFNPNVFNAAFGDGSVRPISTMVNPTVLRALITRAGGEVIRFDAAGMQPTPTAKP